jgi:Bacterial Ig domain/Bacterial Ig-like domain
MDTDGTNPVRLTVNAATDLAPDWQPIPNHAPITANDLLTVPFNALGAAAVLTNDTDEEALSGNNLTVSVQPSHGSTTVDPASGKITYTPTTGYSGSDSLTYRICDSFLLDQKCATAVLGTTVQAPTPTPTPTVALTPTPQAPMVSLSSIGTLKTVPGEQTYYYTGHRPTFSGTATPGSTITIEIHSEPIILTTVANTDGGWSITPPQDLPNGDHTVTVTASKDGVSTVLASYALGINTGLAATGMPIWPLPLAAIVGLIAVRWRLRRQAA